jgi:RNA polymerase sigma factor (sigma-70 family)
MTDSADKNMINSSDEELMVLVTERNTRALTALYDRYGKSLYNFILRYTNNRELSEDLLQETFTKVWFASQTFNPLKGTFKAWIFTIGLNVTRSEMAKKRYSYPHLELDEEAGNGGAADGRGEESADCMLEHAELKDAISAALGRLSPLLREVVILKHYQKLKFSEIAKISNTPEGTLKARLHNALSQLRTMLHNGEL